MATSSDRLAEEQPYAILYGGTLTFYFGVGKPEGAFSLDQHVDAYGTTAPAWVARGEEIRRVVFDKSFSQAQPIDCSYWFYDCTNLENVQGLENLDTRRVTSMEGMFFCCPCLESLDLTHFDTHQVHDMWAMFWGCSALSELDLSQFDTGQVTDMAYMFANCTSLSTLHLSKSFRTEGVTDMREMFLGCSSLSSLDLSGFNTRSVENMEGMFQGCRTLSSLNLSSFSTPEVSNMRAMLAGCSKLTELNLAGFLTSNVMRMDYLFTDCSSLATLNLSAFDTRQVTDMRWMFEGCSALTTILAGEAFTLPQVENSQSMFHNCLSLRGSITYDPEKTDGTYANAIDGYLTLQDKEDAIQMPTEEDVSAVTRRYDLQGRPQTKSYRGVVLESTGARVRKYIVR